MHRKQLVAKAKVWAGEAEKHGTGSLGDPHRVEYAQMCAAVSSAFSRLADFAPWTDDDVPYKDGES